MYEDAVLRFVLLYFVFFILGLFTGQIETRTTYRDDIHNQAQFEGLVRSSRFDYGMRIPDKIDWI